MKQFGSNLRAAPFSHSRKQVITVPGFYKTRLNHVPGSMNKGPDGSKGDGDSMIQAEVPQAPPLNNREFGKERQGRSGTVTMEERQHSMQSVTCNNSPAAARSNGPNPDKGINSTPLISQNTDFHLNDIGRALNEVDPEKDSSHIGTHSNLPFTKSCPHASVKNISTIPDSIGNGSAAFNSGLLPELNTHEAINSTHDSQSPRASTLAPKPRWTMVCRVSSTPQKKVS
nr:hypothetical protein CFP56_05788 [Quercus suber]